MLELRIRKAEFYDEKQNEFYEVPEQTIRLEYSLAAISKWERITKKSFFTKIALETRSDMELFVKCMDLDTHDQLVYRAISNANYRDISAYIQDPQTARTVYNPQKNKGSRYMTSEDFYYAMISNGLPLECENWHFNRLVALLHIFNIRNEAGNGKKMSPKDQYAMYHNLNMARRKALGTKG